MVNLDSSKLAAIADGLENVSSRMDAHMSRADDSSHLNALNLRLSNERNRLAQAKTPKEREQRQVWVAQVEKEIRQEEAFLKKKSGPLPKMSADELLRELLK